VGGPRREREEVKGDGQKLHRQFHSHLIFHQMGPGGSFPGGKADSSPPSSVEVKNAWSYTSTPQYVFMAWCLIKHRDKVTFTFTTPRSRTGEVEVHLYALASTLDGGGRSASPSRKISRYPFDRMLGGVQSRSGRGGVEKKKPDRCPCFEWNPERPARIRATPATNK
jgi:hypothetical protein